MHPLFQFAIVVAVFLGMYTTLILGLKLVAKKRLYNITGLLISSLMLGTVFGMGSFSLILISKKFNSWSFSSKLIYAGEIFVWVFLGSLILLPIAFRRAQSYRSSTKDKDVG